MGGIGSMDMYDSVFSPASVLSEQVARQIFEILPESGLIMVILDREGNSWPSNSDEYSKLNLSEAFLKGLCEKINDGQEPVVTQLERCSIVAAQLVTKRTNCGYIIMALSKSSVEAADNFDLIKVLLNQANLIAKLIEKNNLLYELQMRQHAAAGGQQGPAGFNN
jgi:hypothetical protein